MDPRVEPAGDSAKNGKTMATFHFDLVSPEKLAFSGEVDQVDVPGVEGDFGVLAGHAPVVATVRPAILTITAADVATALADIDRAKFAETINEMQEKLAEKEGSELDHAIERLDHFKSIQQELNTTAMH